MSDFDTALMIATKAHFGQKDKAGKPYILHPLRLALGMNSPDEQIVAVLHDVLEDSNFEIGDFVQYSFSKNILNALVCLTKRDGESYMEYIQRVKTNKIATAVKLCDLKDNLNITRLLSLNDKDFSRIKKYHEALKLLTNE